MLTIAELISKLEWFKTNSMECGGTKYLVELKIYLKVENKTRCNKHL